MATTPPAPGSGRFPGYTGAWFGSQVGSTVWMLLAAVLFAPEAPWVAAACLLCFTFANVLGSWLWRQRDRRPPYRAFQLLFAVLGASGLLAMASIDLLRPAGIEPGANWTNEFRHGLLVVVGVPLGMIAAAALMEWGSKKASAKR